MLVRGLSGVREVALGAAHTAAVDGRGALHSWGDAGDVRLGHGERYREETVVNADRVVRERRRLDMLLEPCAVRAGRGFGAAAQGA